MRLIVLPLLVAFVLAGILFGSLNPGWVEVDLHALRFQAPLGVLLLSVLALGALAGGICLWFSVIMPLNARLRRVGRTSDNGSGR